MDNHDIAHYVIAGVLAVGGMSGGALLSHRVDAVHVSHMGYAGLTGDQQSTLIADMEAMGKHDLTIWCTTPACADLAEDIEYSAYQAGWDTHYQSISIYGLPKGISVAAATTMPKGIVDALSAATGAKVAVTKVDPRDAADLSIVLGDK